MLANITSSQWQQFKSLEVIQSVWRFQIFSTFLQIPSCYKATDAQLNNISTNIYQFFENHSVTHFPVLANLTSLQLQQLKSLEVIQSVWRLQIFSTFLQTSSSDFFKTEKRIQVGLKTDLRI